jgi:hypothetical protein
VVIVTATVPCLGGFVSVGAVTGRAAGWSGVAGNEQGPAGGVAAAEDGGAAELGADEPPPALIRVNAAVAATTATTTTAAVMATTRLRRCACCTRRACWRSSFRFAASRRCWFVDTLDVLSCLRWLSRSARSAR